MARLSVTTAWGEAVAFVKARARLAFALAFMAIALPAAVMRALLPDPAAAESRFTAGFYLAVAAAVVLGAIGNLAISHLAIRGSASGREAISIGVRRAPSLIAASILVGCGLIAFAFLTMAIVFGAVYAANGRALGNAEAVGAAWLLLLVLLPALLYLGGRIALMAAIPAAESAGPFAIIARSWRLTAPYRFKMMGLAAILVVLAVVLQLAVESVLGIAVIALAGAPEPGSVSAVLILLVLATLNAVLATYGAALVARVYAQLAAGDA